MTTLVDAITIVTISLKLKGKHKMKKTARILASIITLLSLTLVPVTVHAQTVEEVPSELPVTGGTELKAPDTGFAPSNKVIQNSAVFIGGSLLGAGIGLGVITLQKTKSQKQS